MDDEDINQRIADYFGMDSRPEIREVPFENLSERRALQFPGGREVYVSLPFDGTNKPPDWEAITEYARRHPEVKALLWLNGRIKEL